MNLVKNEFIKATKLPLHYSKVDGNLKFNKLIQRNFKKNEIFSSFFTGY